MKDIFLGRQPILDKDLNVHGYELLFRASDNNKAVFDDGNAASSQVILNTFMDIGLDNIVGTHNAFINFTPELILNEATLDMPRGRIVIELLEHIEPTDEIIYAVEKLSQHGFTIALDDFFFQKNLQPLIDYADIIKIDIQAMTKDEVKEHINIVKNNEIKFLAEKVETQEDYDFCNSLGFDYFQGYFFAHPNVIKGRTAPANRLNVIRVLSALQNPDIRIQELDALISHDVSMSYRVLRYINSAYFALPDKVESIKKAINLMGLRHIKQLVGLLSFAQVDGKSHELYTIAMIRARMCELCSKTLGYNDSDSYFTVGLFSILDALFDDDMESILSELPLSDHITTALLKHAGTHGEILKFVLAYERGDWENINLGALTESDVCTHYLESLEWANQALSALDL